MDLTLIAQGLVSGVLFGGVYSLMAVGLTLIFGVMRIVNFAHGDMMVWGMYLAWLLATRLGLDPTLGFALAAGGAVRAGSPRPAGARGPRSGTPRTRCRSSCSSAWAWCSRTWRWWRSGRSPSACPHRSAGVTLWLGPVFIDMARLVAFTVAVALTVGLWLFLRRTDLGRTMRATADNPYGALVVGTDVRRVYATAFGIGAACVGAAGALVAPILPFSPSAGLPASVTSFNIVIIGGMGSLPGAFAGGLIVSVAESLGALFLSPSMKELVSFGLLILILLLRPAGLFGRRA